MNISDSLTRRRWDREGYESQWRDLNGAPVPIAGPIVVIRLGIEATELQQEPRPRTRGRVTMGPELGRTHAAATGQRWKQTRRWRSRVRWSPLLVAGATGRSSARVSSGGPRNALSAWPRGEGKRVPPVNKPTGSHMWYVIGSWVGPDSVSFLMKGRAVKNGERSAGRSCFGNFVGRLSFVGQRMGVGRRG
jgi:hypothetical protein